MSDNFEFILMEFACAVSVDARDSDRYSKQDVADCRGEVCKGIACVALNVAYPTQDRGGK